MLTQSRKGAKECKAWRSRKTTPPPIRFRNTYFPGAIDCHSGTYVEYRNTLFQGLPFGRSVTLRIKPLVTLLWGVAELEIGEQ